MNPPHAIETYFTPTEQQTMQGLATAKATLQAAYMNNPMVNAIINSCQAAGLFELDQLRVLCANLLVQHDQASTALINMDNRIKELQATRYSQVQRRIFETWQTDGVRYARCDDGTCWKFVHDKFSVANPNPHWEPVYGMTAMIPQPGDE